MSCPRENQIVRLVGGELPEADEREVRRHLATCTSCAAAVESLRATWKTLGTWHVNPVDIDLTDRVLEQATQPHGPGHGRRYRKALGVGPLRVAASIALAAGLGVAAGAMVPQGQTVEDSQSPSVPTAGELVETLGLVELATESATGLPLGFELEVPVAAEATP